MSPSSFKVSWSFIPLPKDNICSLGIRKEMSLLAGPAHTVLRPTAEPISFLMPGEQILFLCYIFHCSDTLSYCFLWMHPVWESVQVYIFPLSSNPQIYSRVCVRDLEGVLFLQLTCMKHILKRNPNCKLSSEYTRAPEWLLGCCACWNSTAICFIRSIRKNHFILSKDLDSPYTRTRSN